MTFPQNHFRVGGDGELYLPRDYCIPMSTVITWFKTVEGLVIGSDGRNSDAETGQIVSDEAQKIFPVEQPRVRLAYGLAATIRIGQGQDQIVFDFGTETARAFKSLAVHRWNDWTAYTGALTNSLLQSLNGARESSGCTLNRPSEAYIFLGGFYASRQNSGHIRFSHGTMSSEAELSLHPSGFNAPPFGSKTVFDLVDKEDLRFAQYSRPKRDAVLSLSEGIERAEKDIRAHYDPEALKVDPDRCQGIGGRIQIATVTFGHGFKWVPGFEPI